MISYVAYHMYLNKDICLINFLKVLECVISAK